MQEIRFHAMYGFKRKVPWRGAFLRVAAREP
jgi:hypothetical protein